MNKLRESKHPYVFRNRTISWKCFVSYALKYRGTFVERRLSGGGKVETQGSNMILLGEGQWEKTLFKLLQQLDYDTNFHTRQAHYEFLFRDALRWISGYRKTKSPKSLERLFRESKLFLFGDNSCYHGEVGWFTFLSVPRFLGSSFYNENVIRFSSGLASSLNICWDYLSKGKIATSHLIKYIILDNFRW